MRRGHRQPATPVITTLCYAGEGAEGWGKPARRHLWRTGGHGRLPRAGEGDSGLPFPGPLPFCFSVFSNLPALPGTGALCYGSQAVREQVHSPEHLRTLVSGFPAFRCLCRAQPCLTQPLLFVGSQARRRQPWGVITLLRRGRGRRGRGEAPFYPQAPPCG